MMKPLIAVAALALAGSANATVLFSDNFDGHATDLTVTSLAGWTVTGNVDVVDSGTYAIDCDVKCVDLDGTKGPGALLSNAIAFSAGKLITVSFDLSGNQRDSSSDDFGASILFGQPTSGYLDSVSGPVDFSFGAVLSMLGGTAYVESIPGDRPFFTYSYSFVANNSGTFQLGFQTLSADNIGPVLDNVLVSQAGGVPEPATWALLIAGFGMVGATMRRRRAIAA